METGNFIQIKKDNNHKRNKILVNLITFIRSLGTVAIVPIYSMYGSLATALATIGFFATDFIDGSLARKLHVESFFGCLLDALSDKTFGIVCLLILSTLNPIFLAVIGVELGILAINCSSIKRGNNVQSSFLGKAKTFLLAISIIGSFLVYAAPTVKELLNYINITSFNTLLEMNPQFLSTILAVPTIGANLYVAADYNKKAKEQDEERRINLEAEAKPKTLEDYMASISEIHAEKKDLLNQKAAIINKKRELKSGKEILHDLFDTPFYLEHKDDGYKKLLFK